MLKAANLTLAFVLELAALAALAYWGVQAGGSGPGPILLGLGAPLALGIIWGLFLAPKAGRRLPQPARLAAKVAVFGVVALALAAAGQPAAALLFAAVVAANLALSVAWQQDL